MAIEFLLFPAAVGGAFAIRSILKDRKQNDGKTIKEVFENRKIGFVKGKGKNAYIEYPRLVKVIDTHKLYDVRIYRLPIGIPFDAFKQLQSTLQDALGRDIDISFKNRCAVLKIARTVLSPRIPLKPMLGQTRGWNVLIGVNSFEAATHDFDKYPHIVGGGVTRFGKTVLMKNIMVQLLLQQEYNVRFWIIDLKGGVEFWEYEDLKQVKRVTAKALDAFFLLRYLNKKLELRMKYFKRKGYKNIVDTPIKQRDIVIIDESHDLFKTTDKAIDAKKAKDIEYFVGKLASMGGAFGFRIIAFTQYPVKEAMPQFVKQNAPVRIGFQVADSTASRVILDQGGLEDLPGIPGRCMVKSFNYTTVQVPYIDDHMTLLTNLERRKKRETSRKRREHIVEFG